MTKAHNWKYPDLYLPAARANIDYKFGFVAIKQPDGFVEFRGERIPADMKQDSLADLVASEDGLKGLR